MRQTHTRYGFGNCVLLVIGTVLAIFLAFMTTMTFAFGDVPGNSFQRVCLELYGVASFLSFPVFLLMFRWSGFGSIAMWLLSLSCAILAMLGREFEDFIGFVLIQIVLSLFTSGIDSASKEVKS